MFQSAKNAFAATTIKEKNSIAVKTVKITGYVAATAAVVAAAYYGYKHFTSSTGETTTAADIPAAE